MPDALFRQLIIRGFADLQLKPDEGFMSHHVQQGHAKFAEATQAIRHVLPDQKILQLRERRACNEV